MIYRAVTDYLSWVAAVMAAYALQVMAFVAAALALVWAAGWLASMFDVAKKRLTRRVPGPRKP